MRQERTTRRAISIVATTIGIAIAVAVAVTVAGASLAPSERSALPRARGTPLVRASAADTAHDATPSAPLAGDDFKGYHDEAALRANTGPHQRYNDGSRFDLLALDRTVTYQGHPTARLDFPAGVPHSPQLSAELPRAVSSVWLRVVLRYAPGFDTHGTGLTYGNGGALVRSSDAYKMIALGWAGMNGRAGLELTNHSQYTVNNVVQLGGTTFGNAGVAAGDARAEWNDGRWYEHAFLYEPTGPSSSRLRYWRRGAGDLWVLRADVRASYGGRPVPRVGRVDLGKNYNQVRRPGQALAINVGEWQLWDAAAVPDPMHLLPPR